MRPSPLPPRPFLLLLHHLLLPASLPLLPRRLNAVLAEEGSGRWMRRHASAGAPSELRAVVGKGRDSIPATASQFNTKAELQCEIACWCLACVTKSD